MRSSTSDTSTIQNRSKRRRKGRAGRSWGSKLPFILLLAAGLGIYLRAATFSLWWGLASPPVRVDAVCRADSRPASSGAIHFLTLTAVEDRRGNRAEARGEILAWSRDPVYFPWGSRVRFVLEGRDSPEEQLRAGLLLVRPRENSLSGLYRLRYSGRNLFRIRLDALPPQAAVLLEALLLGFRQRLLSPLGDAFRRAGCAHLLALSGMHLAIIMGFGGFAAGLLFPRFLARWAMIPLIPVYLFLVGPAPSLVRASMMFLAVTAGRGARRRVGGLRLLLFTCILMLAISPGFLTDAGFLYSFSALVGLMIITPPVVRVLARGIPYPCAALLGAGIGAFAATLPFSLLFGFGGNPLGFIAALLLTPFIWLYLAGGVLYLIIPALPSLTPLFRLYFWVLYRGIDRLLNIFAGIPLFTPEAPWSRLIAALLGLAFLLRLLYACSRGEPKRIRETSCGADTLEFKATDQ